MARARREDNTVPGLVAENDVTSKAEGIKKDNTSEGLYVHIKGSDTEATDFNGGPVTIGTTAVEITFTGKTQSISIKSASTNTGIIFIGASDVTSAGLNAMGELTADSPLTLDLNDASAPVYAVSDTASQTIYKLALT